MRSLSIWWKVAPLLSNGLILLWTIGLSVAAEGSESFSQCAQKSTDCDWLIFESFWILPISVLWHIGLVLVATPRWKYLLYGLINSIVLAFVWVFSLAFLTYSFGMSS